MAWSRCIVGMAVVVLMAAGCGEAAEPYAPPEPRVYGLGEAPMLESASQYAPTVVMPARPFAGSGGAGGMPAVGENGGGVSDGDGGVGSVGIRPVVSPTAVLLAVPLEPEVVPTCRDEFREMLLGEKRGMLIHEVRDLDRLLRKNRVECQPPRWAPLFGNHGGCDSSNGEFAIGRGDQLTTVSPSFVVGSRANRDRRLGGTGNAVNGDVLVVFQRMPDTGMRGCWYYDAGIGLWYEEIFGSTGGAALPPAARGGCEDAVREVVASVTRGGSVPDEDDIARLVVEVQAGRPGCSPVDWTPRMVARLPAGCGYILESGVDRVVIAWDGWDGSGIQCWSLSADGQSWRALSPVGMVSEGAVLELVEPTVVGGPETGGPGGEAGLGGG